MLYYASPNVKLRGFRWVMPGAAFALVVWILASIAFAFYVANFGSYDKTYGTLGGGVREPAYGEGSPTRTATSRPLTARIEAVRILAERRCQPLSQRTDQHFGAPTRVLPRRRRSAEVCVACFNQQRRR